MGIFLKQVLWITVMLFGAMHSALAEECEPIEAAEVLKAEQLRLNSQMQNNLDITSKLLDDQLVYVRQGARVFKECIAAELLPAEQFSAILTLQPDAKLAREVLPDDMYDACCIYNNSNVVVV